MSEARVVAAEAGLTASGQSAGVTPGGSSDKSVDTLVLFLDVTALAGTTPTLDVELQWSFDDGASWVSATPAAPFAQATGPTTEIIEAPIQAPLYRFAYTIGGTVTTGADFTIREHTR